MTTGSEFRAMLLEEINEPPDYPRVDLDGGKLADYNDGFVRACRTMYANEFGLSDNGWKNVNVHFIRSVIDTYADAVSPWLRGRHDAYAWGLTELDSAEPDETETVTISRARYNYLLDLEHDAHDFAAKFAEWGES